MNSENIIQGKSLIELAELAIENSKKKLHPVDILTDPIIREKSKSFENGYRKGYAQAINACFDEIERLNRKGFNRQNEVLNIFGIWADDLMSWRYNPRQYLPPSPKRFDSWHKISKRILERDGHKCVNCGETKDLHIDHIKPVRRGGLPDDENLQVLCRTCNLCKGSKYNED